MFVPIYHPTQWVSNSSSGRILDIPASVGMTSTELVAGGTVWNILAAGSGEVIAVVVLVIPASWLDGGWDDISRCLFSTIKTGAQGLSCRFSLTEYAPGYAALGSTNTWWCCRYRFTKYAQVYQVRSMIGGTGIECLMMPMFIVRVPPGRGGTGRLTKLLPIIIDWLWPWRIQSHIKIPQASITCTLVHFNLQIETKESVIIASFDLK